ncbi:hypothetical protein, variant [Exophiala oligosperma]|uniref:Uncharacterized protein n=1 Tax=Exophiala oligosperma TaxID=215243 RepID=A0A0D2DMT5_9EURO|nr:hypothetical protein, variant [Exophiala oligosperma]KIW37009.1 hypothetical protein, variant [Exophiala oligosperma]
MVWSVASEVAMLTLLASQLDWAGITVCRPRYQSGNPLRNVCPRPSPLQQPHPLRQTYWQTSFDGPSIRRPGDQASDSAPVYPTNQRGHIKPSSKSKNFEIENANGCLAERYEPVQAGMG